MNKELEEHLAALDQSYADGWGNFIQQLQLVAIGELSGEAVQASLDAESAVRMAIHERIVASLFA